jgi:Protein of unknown function (DUF2490)
MKPGDQKIRGTGAKRMFKSKHVGEVPAPCTLAMLFLSAVIAPAVALRADDPSDENQLTLSLHHPISGDLSGFAELGFRWNPDEDYHDYTILYPGLTYTAAKWLQFSAGLRTLFTDNANSANEFELRPFAGVKLFLPNKLKWNIFNYTRYEYRDTQNRDTDEWTGYSRVRSEFGVEIPLTSREQAWHSNTWYLTADVEPFYRFDKSTIDPFRFGGGIGYVLNDRLQIELIYQGQMSRPSGGSGLEYTESIIHLNFKIGLQKGILQRVLNPASD